MPEQPKTETPLHMAQRHVDGGRARVARQEQLIADLERDGRGHMLPEANRLLHEMQKIQAQAEEHLALRLAENVARRTRG